MTEQALNVSEEIQNEEVIQPQTGQTESQNIQAEPQKQNDKDYNFAQLRKGKEQLEKQVQELQSHVNSLDQKSNQRAIQEEDDGIDDEDIIEGRHLKKVNQELKALREQLNKEQSLAVQDRLNMKFSDFDKVVSKENVEKLKMTEPELYTSIVSSPDLFSKGVSAYKTLKALGIVAEDFSSEKETVQSNHKKPISTQAIKGQGALSDGNVFARGLTPELRDQLRKEMNEAIKSR